MGTRPCDAAVLEAQRPGRGTVLVYEVQIEHLRLSCLCEGAGNAPCRNGAFARCVLMRPRPRL